MQERKDERKRLDAQLNRVEPERVLHKKKMVYF